MANKIEFNIFVKGAEDVKKTFNTLGDSLDEFSKVTKMVGRELSQVGQTVALVGASISGPLVLAFNNASKSSKEAAEQTKRFKETTDEFNKLISSSLVPIFEKFNNGLQKLFDAFQKIDKATRDQIIQGALMAGVVLTVAGTMTVLIGKTIALASNIAGLVANFLLFAAANPIIIAISAAIVGLIILMFKFKGVADVVLSTFQVLFILLQNGFLTIKAVFESTIASMLDTLTKFSDVIGKLPSVLGYVVKNFGGEIQQASASLKTMAQSDLQAVADKTQELSEIIKTGQGSWSIGFDDLKTKIGEFFAALNQGTAEASSNGFFTGFKAGLDEVGAKIKNVQEIGNSLAQTLHQNLSTAFSDIFLGAKTAKEAFIDLGKAMLKAIVDFAAQWLAFQILSKALALVGVTFAVTQAAIVGAAWAPAAALASLATLGGNAAPASAALTGTVGLANLLAVPKFAEGSGGIKDDTLGMFNKKEIVVPGTFSDAIKRGELSLSGGESQQSSGNIVFDFTGATFNGITDKFVEEVFTKASENITNRTLAFRGAV